MPALSAAPTPTAACPAAAATANSCAPSAVIAEMRLWAYLIVAARANPWSSALSPRRFEAAPADPSPSRRRVVLNLDVDCSVFRVDASRRVILLTIRSIEDATVDAAELC